MQRGASPNQTAACSRVYENKQRCLGVKGQLKVVNVLPKSDSESDDRSGLRAGDGDPPWKVQTECFNGDPAGKSGSCDHCVQRLSSVGLVLCFTQV